MKKILFLLAPLFCLNAQVDLEYYLGDTSNYNQSIPTPESIIGHQVGELHVSHDKLSHYVQEVSKYSERVKLVNRGKTSFSSADRIAIKDVIDAYGFYWDTNNLDGYLSLFTDSAKGVVINVDGNVDNYYIKSEEQIENNKNRMDYFINNQMQRRHMMANSFFIELTNDYAHLRQYMILMTTNKKEKTEILTPINYVFKLIKLNGIWKIIYREINLDKPLDLSL